MLCNYVYTQQHNKYIAHLILLKVKILVILLKSENYHRIDYIEILRGILYRTNTMQA